MSKILRILYFPLSWILYILYITTPESERKKLLMDLRRFRTVHYKDSGGNLGFWKIYKEFMGFEEFRSVFYLRVGNRRSKLIRWMFPARQFLLDFDCKSKDVCGGIFIQHGYCTDICVRSIGENVWINQKVTLGYQGDGCPTLGNNVHIGVGANIIGDVHIGNNVNIGAGATVVKDVPDNTTVVGQPARYIPKER